MKTKPAIIVQLVHIKGPLEGEIQEFSESEISIGRHSTCHVRFPKDQSVISRKHAQILREGNHFKLVDLSINGTFVNGKRLKEAYLKDGDVLTITEGGPKVSFLTRIIEQRHEDKPLSSPSTPRKTEISPQETPGLYHAQPEPSPREGIPTKRVRVPLAIQYGPTLRSFDETPVIIGKSPSCDFTIEHPAIHDRHAEILFSQDQYWVKDLTGQRLVSINGAPVHFEAPLNPNNTLELSPQGPKFRFLGGGRLAEIED